MSAESPEPTDPGAPSELPADAPPESAAESTAEPTRQRTPEPRADPDWMTLGQAAKFLGVAQSTIRKWSDLGRVPAFYTPGGHRRYRRSDLEDFIASSGPGSQT
jgi:excisionase family DNA binding protein